MSFIKDFIERKEVRNTSRKVSRNFLNVFNDLAYGATEFTIGMYEGAKDVYEEHKTDKEVNKHLRKNRDI